MSIVSICKKDIFVSLPYIITQKVKSSWKEFVSLVKVGYSVFHEQLLMRSGFMLSALMAAHQGNNAMAAHQVGMNLLGLSFSFGDGLQVAAIALIGRSLGEKKPELAKQYGKTCRLLGGCISVALALVYAFLGKGIFSLFFREQEIVAIGVRIIYIMILILLFQISQVVFMGCLRSAGDTFYTAIATTVSVTVIRSLGSYFFGYIMGWGITGIWCGILADQFSRYLFSSIRFKMGKWVQIKI
jgi:Na+-driven multidrug efflux pump